MSQEQLGRLRGPKGPGLGQLECCGASSAQDSRAALWSGCHRGSGQGHQLMQARSSWCQAPSATCPAQGVLPSLAPATLDYIVAALDCSWSHSEAVGAGHPCTGGPSSFLGPVCSLCFPFLLPHWTLPPAQHSSLPECPALSLGPGRGPSASLPGAALLLRGKGPPRGSPLCLHPAPSDWA